MPNPPSTALRRRLQTVLDAARECGCPTPILTLTDTAYCAVLAEFGTSTVHLDGGVVVIRRVG